MPKHYKPMKQKKVTKRQSLNMAGGNKSVVNDGTDQDKGKTGEVKHK